MILKVNGYTLRGRKENYGIFIFFLPSKLGVGVVAWDRLLKQREASLACKSNPPRRGRFGKVTGPGVIKNQVQIS